MGASWVDEYMEMVTDCEDRESRLTPWEVGFIASIHGLLDTQTFLTPRQVETLEKVWENVTRKG